MSVNFNTSFNPRITGGSNPEERYSIDTVLVLDVVETCGKLFSSTYPYRLSEETNPSKDYATF